MKDNESIVKGLSFGEAISAMKRGKKVSRKAWSDKGMYLWYLPPAIVKKDWVKEPQVLSVYEYEKEFECLGSVRMMTPTGEVITGWLASHFEMFAEDWCVLEDR